MAVVDGVIFISYRMSESKPEAKEMEAALQQRTRKTIRVNELPGADLAAVVAEAIDECDLAVVLGSETYGEKTSGMIDTYKELQFIMSEQKPIFLIKACDRFKNSATRMLLDFNTMTHTEWKLGSRMPDGLVEDIMQTLRNIKEPSGQQSSPTVPAQVPAAAPAPVLTQAPVADWAPREIDREHHASHEVRDTEPERRV